MTNVIQTAIKWNCKDTLLYGLNTNQFILQCNRPEIITNQIQQIPVINAGRLITCAGQAVWYHKRFKGPAIKLHSALFDKHDELYKKRFETFFHEIAHHIAKITDNEKGHGFAWQYSMMQFGFKPERCYNGALYDFKNYKRREEHREVQAVLAELPPLDL